LTRLLAPWTTTSSTSRRERTTTSSASWWPFVGLHCEPLPASTSFGYFRQGQSNIMSISAGNGATGASCTGPALGYTLNIFWFNFLLMLISKNNMNTCTYLIHTLSLIYAMKLLVIFGIKIYRKLPSCLTSNAWRECGIFVLSQVPSWSLMRWALYNWLCKFRFWLK